MSTILTTKDDFLAFIQDQKLPNGNLSIRGVARCCDVSPQAIIEGADFKSKKLAKSLVDSGFQAAHLAENGFPPQAVWLTIEYFAFDSKAKAPMAKAIARTFGSIGVIGVLADEPCKEVSQGEFLMMAGKALFEMEQRQKLLEDKLALEAQRTTDLEDVVRSHDGELDRLFKPDGNYYSIRGYASLKGFNLSLKEANLFGRKAAKLSRERNIPIDSLPDPRYGEVGIYSEYILEKVFA